MAYAGMLQQNLFAPGQEQMGPKYWPGDTSDPYAVLDQIQGVNIIEKVQGMEILTGYESGNKYMIKDAKTGCDLFMAVECQDGMMGVLGRQALSGPTRPFNVKVGMMTGEGQPPTRFAMLERPYACTCCCLNRPVSLIKDSKTGGQAGGITEPCAPCAIKLVLFDDKGEHYGQIDRCCTAMCCFGTPCNKVFEMPIKTLDGKELAIIKKHATVAGLVSAVTGVTIDADNFSVHFKEGMTPQQKMHAISTAIFMDFAYFTKGATQSQSAAGNLGQAIGGDEGGAIGALAGFAIGAVSAATKERDPAMEW